MTVFEPNKQYTENLRQYKRKVYSLDTGDAAVILNQIDNFYTDIKDSYL